MIKQFVNYMVKEKIIEQDDAEVQEFALQFLIQSFIAHSAIFVVAFLFHVFAKTIIYEIVFMPLRSYAGGFHAKTPTRCFVVSFFVWSAVMGVSAFLASECCFLFLIVAACILWKYAPIPHANNPLSEKRFHQVKRICKGLILVNTAAIVICYFAWNPEYALVAALSMLAVSLSLLAVKYLVKASE